MRVMRAGQFFGHRLLSRQVGELSFTDSVYPPGSRFESHSHLSPFCAVVVAGGYSERTCSTSYECPARSLLFHRAGEVHSNRMGNRGARVVSIEFPASWMNRMPQLEVKNTNPQALAHLIPSLVAELRTDDQASVLALEALVLEMLSESMRHTKRARQQNAHPPWLKRVRQVLEECYPERLTLAGLARVAQVHPVHLAREFRKAFGCTVGEELRRRRIQHACQELMETRWSITEIAARAGFADHSHMARLVRAYTGYSPRELRRRSRR